MQFRRLTRDAGAQPLAAVPQRWRHGVEPRGAGRRQLHVLTRPPTSIPSTTSRARLASWIWVGLAPFASVCVLHGGCEAGSGDRADDRGVDRELSAVPQRQAVGDYLDATCITDRYIDVHVANPNVPGYSCSVELRRVCLESRRNRKQRRVAIHVKISSAACARCGAGAAELSRQSRVGKPACPTVAAAEHAAARTRGMPACGEFKLARSCSASVGGPASSAGRESGQEAQQAAGAAAAADRRPSPPTAK